MSTAVNATTNVAATPTDKAALSTPPGSRGHLSLLVIVALGLLAKEKSPPPPLSFQKIQTSDPPSQNVMPSLLLAVSLPVAELLLLLCLSFPPRRSAVSANKLWCNQYPLPWQWRQPPLPPMTGMSFVGSMGGPPTASPSLLLLNMPLLMRCCHCLRRGLPQSRRRGGWHLCLVAFIFLRHHLLLVVIVTIPTATSSTSSTANHHTAIIPLLVMKSLALVQQWWHLPFKHAQVQRQAQWVEAIVIGNCNRVVRIKRQRCP